MKIEIGDKEYDIKLAETTEEKSIGLSKTNALDKNEGMLFIYSEDQELDFWMKDTSIPLDIIFINSDDEVTSIHGGNPESEEIISGYGKYVLEVNKNSGIQVGDELDFDDPEYKMYVIDPDGNTQMKLKSGERIFSRKNTKSLIKFANKADKSKLDKDYKSLGSKLFKYLDIQDSNKTEYVEK